MLSIPDATPTDALRAPRSCAVRTAALVASLMLSLPGCAAAPATPQLSSATTAHDAGLVDIRSRVPDLDLDIRYAGADNFVGHPIAGYDAPRCWLLPAVADALQRVEIALRREGLRLRVFDCYRPARAVREFVAWAGDERRQQTRAAYYPNLEKASLLGDYIAPLSGHSRGATLDLTLLRCDPAPGHCTPLDMGTPFDFFDPRAHTEAPGLDPAQRRHRRLLVDAMAHEGFVNYALEWWHYTWQPEPSPGIYFDVPIRDTAGDGAR
jgi:zinc D-Ala-D-Ala dipeptidase